MHCAPRLSYRGRRRTAYYRYSLICQHAPYNKIQTGVFFFLTNVSLPFWKSAEIRYATQNEAKALVNYICDYSNRDFQSIKMVYSLESSLLLLQCVYVIFKYCLSLRRFENVVRYLCAIVFTKIVIYPRYIFGTLVKVLIKVWMFFYVLLNVWPLSEKKIKINSI